MRALGTGTPRIAVSLGMAAWLIATLAAPAHARPADTRTDAHSYARPAEARVTDVALDLAADFSARTLSGTATLTIDHAPGAREIVLDTRDLVISSVTDAAGGSLDYSLGEPDRILGRALRIALPASGRHIVVHYRTTPESAALQWLAPEQTAGRRHPYLFSQGEAILTRTWVPTQDSPGIRQTCSARIVVPRDLVAVMSAESLTPGGTKTPGGRVFTFRLDHPVPPYLFALAVGDIAFKPVGNRTGVYSEPSVLDAAAWELADLEKMLEATEALYGPYRWGRYDVLVLPPSFPFGGMENPRLTFMSPTMIAGDRSLTSIAAHELAHSWSGNLVTNATWRDVWLNEGFTTYIERRIVEQLYGRDASAAIEMVGREELTDELRSLPPRDSILHIDLAGRGPDAGPWSVPYEKGAAFLRMLELGVGREPFDAWLRRYFDRHAFQSITTPQLLEDLRATLLAAEPGLEKRLHVREWLFEPGLPANTPTPSSPALAQSKAEALRFSSGTPAASIAITGWTTQQWRYFLAALPERLSRARLEDLDKTFTLSNRSNAEVLFSWLRVAIRNEFDPAVPAAERLLTSQGRLKFLQPLYTALMQTPWGQPIARRTYDTARPLYHPVARAALDPLFSE